MAQAVAGYPDPAGVDLVDCHQIVITLPGLGDVDVTSYVKSFAVTKSLTTDLPDGSRLQTGLPAMTADFTLADESVGPFGGYIGFLFGRYSVGSPLYHESLVHAAVAIDAGLDNGAGPVLVRQFTGVIDTYDMKPDGTVEFSCIDRRALLRSVASLPPVVTLPPYNAGLTSEYAVDALLRAARPNQDISSWPARRPSAVLGVGFRTSLWPETGTLDATYTQPPGFSFTPGVFGSALTNTVAEVRYLTAAPVSTSVFAEWWTTGIDTAGESIVQVSDGGTTNRLLMQMDAINGVFVEIGISTSHTWMPSGGITSGGHHVGFSFTGGTLTVFYDGQTHSFGAAGPFAAMGHVAVTCVAGGTIEGLQVTGETSPTFSAFTPGADLNPSLNTLQVVPEMSGDPWQVIQQIADAELGICGFNEHGIFRFRNRRNVQSQPLSLTVTSDTSLVNLEIQTSAASVANRCQVDATPWQFLATTRIYELDTLVRVPAHGSVTLTPTLDALAVETDPTVALLPDGWRGTAFSYYRASMDRFGTAAHPGLNFTVTQINSTQLRIVISNPTSSDAYLVSPASYTDIAVGTPLLYIAGVPVIASAAVTQDFQWPPVIAGIGGAPDTGGAASTPTGEIAVQLTGNPWIQDRDDALKLAQDVVIDQCVARDTFDNVSIVPNHLIQLADLVRVIDTDGAGVDEYGYVFGAALSYDNGSQSQTITIRTLGPPGAWLVGIPGRSEIGVGGTQGTAYVYA